MTPNLPPAPPPAPATAAAAATASAALVSPLGFPWAGGGGGDDFSGSLHLQSIGSSQQSNAVNSISIAQPTRVLESEDSADGSMRSGLGEQLPGMVVADETANRLQHANASNSLATPLDYYLMQHFAPWVPSSTSPPRPIPQGMDYSQLELRSIGSSDGLLLSGSAVARKNKSSGRSPRQSSRDRRKQEQIDALNAVAASQNQITE